MAEELKRQAVRAVMQPQEGVEDTWRTFVELLKMARDAWDRNKEKVLSLGSKDNLPEDLQRHLALPYVRSSFELGLPRMIEYYQTRGGIDFLTLEGDKKWQRKRAGARESS